MSLLSLDISKCVHTSNKLSACESCVSACPVDTIKVQDNVVSFIPSECVGCGGCGAACPTAAYTLDDFNPINYIFKFLEEDKEVLTCKSELPCIAAFSADELLSLSLFSKEEITLDIGPCAECAIAKTNLQIIKDRAEEANFLLEAMMQTKRLHVKTLSYTLEEETKAISRRDLLTKDSVKRVSQIKQQFLNRVDEGDDEIKLHNVTTADIVKIKQKKVPDRRSLLLMALKRADVPQEFHIISAKDISFISQKELDAQTCTNCQMCYRICPTGALSSDIKGSFIAFNPLACVKCQSCHDVCEPGSLMLKQTFNLKNFFEPKAEELIRFDMKRCNECNTPFAYRGGEILCNRCMTEEEEARELWGVR
ncbi:4Fe-4S dicluster domain-containing protein [Sulfurimonas sp. HSL-1716]|uniref:4Fe-4S dicluster domain-containing protein n=1 Tax=Hydrocurvibacter sulfurireducens TaxID=3131937 RepID=UPI0031F80595